MKTLVLKSLANQVKVAIETARGWSYEYCGRTAGSDVEKAINYLDTQKFSVDYLSKLIEGDYKMLLEYLRENKREGSEMSVAELVAVYFADNIAFDRTYKFRKSTLLNPWSIDEGTCFKLIF